MEGNKFHDPETPPSIHFDINPIFSRNSKPDDSTSDAATSEKTLGRDSEDAVALDIESSSSDDITRQRTNHMDIGLDLVSSVTSKDLRRRPSKGGILSNLLKLDVFDDKHALMKHRSSSRPQAHPPRPTHQLKSIASSRALLQTIGASPQSARSSMYFEDLHKAELGISDDAAIAARRMEIASEIASILARQDLIIKLGKSLVRCGAPSHRIESAMEKVGKRLEIDGNYAVLPGLIIVTFGDIETRTSETHLIRCSRSLDIGKLERTNDIAYAISRGELDIEEAMESLDSIINEPPTWSPLVLLFGYTLSSAFVAPLFYNGSWTDCWVSAIFGLCVGILTFISEKIPMFGNIFEMAVTIPIAVITLALHPHVCFAAVAMAAIVIALPGYSLTCSVMELAAKNLISGSVHLVYAMMYVMFLAFGTGYGCSVWRLVHPEDNTDVLSACQPTISPWWIFLLLPLATVGFGIVYGASANQWLPMVGCSAVGYAVYYFVAKVAGASSVITPSAGALALGLFGNIYQRVTKRLAFVPLMGGTIILVPGSLGVKGALSMFDGSNTSNGTEFVGQVLGVALSLTLGLFLANLIVYPKGKKRKVFLGF